MQPAAAEALAASPFALAKGKGSKYIKLAYGPWAAAYSRMPAPPPTGAKRARSSLASVTLKRTDVRMSQAERAARCLVAVLPHGSASFILHDPAEVIGAAPPDATAERLVDALKAYGVGSLNSAYGALGSLKSWAAEHRPGILISGSVYSDFLAAQEPKSRDRLLGSFKWLSDWCGIDTPARAPVARSFRQGRSFSEHNKESFSLFIVLGLEYIAACHPSEFVRGHAAAWLFMALHALRFEQAQSLVINAFYSHPFQGASVSVTVAATTHDKNPDASKVRPRPVWGIFGQLVFGFAAQEALRDALRGAEDAQCTLRDTDSPNGDPTNARRWIASGVHCKGRADASLHALLQLPPISLSAEQAATFHGHSAKRFLLNVAEASDEFSETEANAIGRFSGSVAQSPDLEPDAALLRRHALDCAVLPNIYARAARVQTAFDLLARMHRQLRRIAQRFARGSLVLPRVAGWTEDIFHNVVAPPPDSACSCAVDRLGRHHIL